MPSIIKTIDWRAVAEILILWFVIYRIFLFLKGTKAVYLLRGIIILVIAFFVFQMTNLPVLSLLSKYLFAIFLVFIAIIFQPELREGLIRLGKRHFFSVEPAQEEIEKIMKEIVSAISAMGKNKIGALIAIKREIGLKDFIESGVMLNADITSELLQNIFFPSTPLHDGGVIIGRLGQGVHENRPGMLAEVGYVKDLLYFRCLLHCCCSI